MSASKDGGPAFPDYDCVDEKMNVGMSLRDYFAAKAMQGILAGCVALSDKHGTPVSSQAGIAAISYEIADAMLAEREKAVQP